MWETAKIVLCALYGVLWVAAAIVLIFVWRARPAERCRVPLHLLLVVAPFVRFVENLVTPHDYGIIRQDYLWLQVILDLLPEVLFWQTFVMLVLLWVEMYHFSRNKTTDPSVWSKVSLISLFFIFSGVAYTLIIVFSIAMEVTKKYDMLAEASFLAVGSGVAVIVFVYYGYLTHKRMDRVPLFPPHRKTKRLNRLKFAVFMVVFCNFLHIAFLFLIDETYIKEHMKHYLVVWMCYFIVTEVLPASAILFIFRKPPRFNKNTRTSQFTHVPSNVGQYTPIPTGPRVGPQQFSPQASPHYYSPIQDDNV